jgi:ribose transport system ATP-binding protein
MDMSAPTRALHLDGVVKSYPGVVALKSVSFDVLEGEVHALVGENGAGKSTLMGVAAGSVVPDSGTVEIGGRRLENPSPTTAQSLGLVVVYQHLSILRDLTVTENMVLAMPRHQRPSFTSARAWTREKLEVIGADIDPSARVSELSVAEAQLLEIAKALALEARVCVLDEPTESLNAKESERLFAQIRQLTERGASVVYISHRLPEVRRVADRLTVLRDGETRGTFDVANLSEDEILRRIVGRPIERAFPPKRTGNGHGPPILQIRGLSADRFDDVDVSVARGEIVGLAGVEGNGQQEFLRALAGLGKARGDVEIGGKPVRLDGPRHAAQAGIVHLPGDRHAEGLFLSLSVRENVSLLHLDELATAGVVNRGAENRVTDAQIRSMNIRTPSTETLVGALSGGNQQKVLMARSLLADPMVLLADEPTRGVDAGARIEVYALIRAVAEEGRAVIVRSSDAVELQGLCDRVLVFSRGRIIRELEGDTLTESGITGTAITADTARREQAESTTRTEGLGRFLRGDYMPPAVVMALVIALGIYTASRNEFFLAQLNLTSMLLLVTALAFVSLGQLVVLLTGGIDLSVGPLAGLTVVVVSFFASDGHGDGALVVGALAVIGTAIAVGVGNATLIRVVRLTPVLATLATFIILQGVSLLLRPQPAGTLRTDVTAVITTKIGPIPVAFIVVVVVAVLMEVVLRCTRPGLSLRAVGSDEVRAHRLGVRVNRLLFGAYTLCALFTAIGGIMLASQVAIGDPRVGVNYTLTSIAVVVLGGASIFGGRGSFLGVLAGALLLQELVSATTFLGLGNAWQVWLPGLVILVAAALYSRARGVRIAALE